MKTVSKKLLCLLMVVFLLAAAIPFQAFAAEAPEAETKASTETNEIPETETKASTETNGTTEPETKDSTNSADVTEPDATEPKATESKTTEPDATEPKATEPAPAPEVNVFVDIRKGGEQVATKQIEGKHKGDSLTEAEVVQAVHAAYDSICPNPTGYTIKNIVGLPSTLDTGVTVEVSIEFNPTSFTLTLDANGGSFPNGATLPWAVEYGKEVGKLTEPTRAGYFFGGWFTADGVRIENGTQYKYTENLTVYAKWIEDASRLDVKRVLNSTMTGATTIFEKDVAKSQRVLDYLNTNVKSIAQNSVPAGYSWDGLWRDYALNELTAQDTTMSQSQTVYVNYTPNKYTIFFNVDGGKVDPTSKEVTFDQKVGELPTPTKNKQVFKGWYDESGNLYTKDTIYKVAGNTTLSARWENEAFVLLRIYINGNTKSVDRILDMTKYIENDNVTRAAVEKIIKEYYKPESGKKLSLAGLFTDSTWADYVNDSSKRGTPTVQIKKDSPTYVYVMVKQAKDDKTTVNNGGDGGNSTDPTTSTKPVDKTNPKTGDTVLIYPAAAVMVLAAAALVTIQVIRKKKQF